MEKIEEALFIVNNLTHNSPFNHDVRKRKSWSRKVNCYDCQNNSCIPATEKNQFIDGAGGISFL